MEIDDSAALIHQTYFMMDWAKVSQEPSTTNCMSCGGTMMSVEPIRDKKGVVFDGIYAGKSEACRLQDCLPLALAALFAAGDGEHVEVAHQVAFELRIWMGDERGEDEFNDQQGAVLRDDCAAILEDRNCIRVFTPVQHVLEHVDIGAGGDELGQVGGAI